MPIRMRGRGHNRHDWTAYLVLADQQEEAGDSEKAAKTRRAGRTMRIILDLVDQAASLPVRTRRRETLRADLPTDGVNTFWVTVRASKLEIAVKVYSQTTLPLPPSETPWNRTWLRLTRVCCSRPDYVPERIVKEILPAIGCPLEH